MNQLIRNSQWKPGPQGGPQYFSGSGSTYDALTVNGFRTCSVTVNQKTGGRAENSYGLPIDVRGKRSIRWGYTIRAVEVQSAALVAVFLDGTGKPVKTEKQPVADQVTYQFKEVSNRFPVPQGAAAVRLSLEFSGKVTACTFYAPSASYES